MNLEWYHFLGFLAFYQLARTLLDSKIPRKTISHIFLANLVHATVFVGCLYYGLRDVELVRHLLDGLVSNTALVVAVVGFSLQSALKHIVAGSLVTYSGAFKIGDRITLRARGLTGTVETITLRHTVINTYTNQRVVIPNAILNDEVIINNYLSDRRTSYPVLFLVSPNTDVQLATGIIRQVILEHPLAINESVEVLLSDVTQEGAHLKTFIWTDHIEDNFKVASDVRERVLNLFKENGIQLSYIYN